MTKDVIDAILERRCVRKFSAQEIPEATIGRILDAARWAPSGGNLQPWKFYVVLNQSRKTELAQAAFGQAFLSQAPVVIVVCAVPKASGERYGDRGETLYCLQDTAAAVQNMLLAATGYGLGTCWVGAFDEAGVSKVLELPADLRPVVMIPVGYAETAPKAPARKAIEDVVHVIR